MQATSLIKQILETGSREDKLALFAFSPSDDTDLIHKKFKLFSRSQYGRYFENEDSPEHDVLIKNVIDWYKGECNPIEIAFRGFAKTTFFKLLLEYFLLNDQEKSRRYIKILSKDGANSKQVVTDIYNLIIEVRSLYGNPFENKGDMKREETMQSFTTSDGRKLASGTIGQTQRGHVQDAYRPDLLWFDDVEDRESIASITITTGIINKADEAIQGLAFNGNYAVTGNYISDAGVIQWFLNKQNIRKHIVPIIKNGVPTWKRYTHEKINQLKSDSEDWEGEYLCDPTISGDKFFDIERVAKDLEQATPPDREVAGVRYWGSYQPHHAYAIGEDLSDGVGKDSCALALFDFTKGELLAASDTNTLPPDLFTHEVMRVGREFGNCLVAPEVNNSCGGIAISTLQNNHYDNIYRTETFDKYLNTLTSKVGWETNRKTKPKMFYDFRKDYSDGLIKIYDERVLREMKAFNRTDLKDSTTGIVTRHFDLLTAVVIAWQMRVHASPNYNEEALSRINQARANKSLNE
jgi:hypothetical protein